MDKLNGHYLVFTGIQFQFVFRHLKGVNIIDWYRLRWYRLETLVDKNYEKSGIVLSSVLRESSSFSDFPVRAVKMRVN